jgi:hypothetical protein
MSACCAPFEEVADQQFNRKKVAAELKRYREKGPEPTTRLLEQGIAEAGIVAGTLLDIGSGIGSLDLVGRCVHARSHGPASGIGAMTANGLLVAARRSPSP